ncbi:hypothetical protein E2C01_096450 [Portunus trituberculatus]|uniref:Uncharacterized protein n=1 Tax=Portunus trituberculatus TaxID=210409 RepID=A0A5B7K2T3_PORTR|nr:hypothetical protein [Portunus trituberculatus]
MYIVVGVHVFFLYCCETRGRLAGTGQISTIDGEQRGSSVFCLHLT